MGSSLILKMGVKLGMNKRVARQKHFTEYHCRMQISGRQLVYWEPSCAQQVGKNWFAQSSSITGTFCALFSVSFTDINNGTFVGSSGIVQHTTDGGNTWVAQNSGTTKSLLGVAFLDQNNGIAVGSGGTVLMTNNGGETWTSKLVTENNLRSVSFADINNILIVGENATVVRVTEGGANWDRYYPAVTKVDSDADLFGASYNTFVGAKGQIVCTTNGGTTWDTQRTGPPTTLRGVSFTSSNIGTAVGHSGTILRTIDGGNTWTPQSNDLPLYVSNNMKAVSFIDANNGCIVTGVAYSDSIGRSTPYGAILCTTNGGTTWNVRYYHAEVSFNGASFPSVNTAIAVGVTSSSDADHAHYSRTTNGGASWVHKYFTNITDPLTDVSFVTIDRNRGRVQWKNFTNDRWCLKLEYSIRWYNKKFTWSLFHLMEIMAQWLGTMGLYSTHPMVEQNGELNRVVQPKIYMEYTLPM